MSNEDYKTYTRFAYRSSGGTRKRRSLKTRRHKTRSRKSRRVVS